MHDPATIPFHLLRPQWLIALLPVIAILALVLRRQRAETQWGGVVASHLGLPDAGLASYTEMVGRVHQIASGTSTPLIADGDTGYGGLLNVDHTVRGYERAGAQAIQIEDQEVPKKCGHTPGRRVIPLRDMCLKIEVAVEARKSPDFLIIARTDARTALGLDEAILRRAQIIEGLPPKDPTPVAVPALRIRSQ